MSLKSTKLIFIFLLLPSSSFSQISTTQCGSNNQCFPNTTSSLEIRFPFRILDQQPASCGYPGFRLTCEAPNRTLLKLPNSVFLTVSGIDYINQHVYLTDECLPQKLMSLDFPNVKPPFYFPFYQDFAVFNCSGRYEDQRYNGTFDYDLKKVDCLSGLDYTVYVVNVVWVISLLSTSGCEWAANISVPYSYADYNYFLPDLNSITLYWDEPRCGPCEKELPGRCRVKPGSLRDIQCPPLMFQDTAAGESTRDAILLPLLVGVSLLALGVLCLVKWNQFEKAIYESNLDYQRYTSDHQ